MKRLFNGKLYIKGEEVFCFLNKYSYNDTIAIQILDTDWLPYCTATVCAEGHLKKHPNSVVIKDYSENEGIYKWLVDNDIVEEAIDYINVGYCTCPVVNIKYNNFVEMNGYDD